MRASLILLPLLLLAGCGGDSGNSSEPVAAVTPPAGRQWVDVVAKTEEGYRQGNPDAPVKLVEYGSRTCPVCGAFANTGMEPLREKYISTGRVSLEFREFWVHPQDPAPSLLGNCVPTEAYFPILDQMYAEQTRLNINAEQVYPSVNQQPTDKQPEAWARALGYLEFMKQRGLSEEKALQCLNDKALEKKITDVMAKGQENGVNGTPTFFINGNRVENAVSWAQLEPRLQAAGAR